MFVWRALYLRLYGVLAIAISLWALLQLSQGQWLWLGALLAWGHLPCINAWRRYGGNFAYGDERERLAMTSTLLGVALVFITGSRDWALWVTLGGLFGLLIFVFIATAMPRGLRESQGDRADLVNLLFTEHNQPRSLKQLNAESPVLLLVIHSAADSYSRSAARELQQLLTDAQLPLPAGQCVLVFPGDVPDWARSLMDQGVHCWSDPEGDSLATLGLWLRGGNWSFAGGPHAARPLLAVIEAGQSAARLWVEAANFRVPPSVQENLTKISRLV